jgi:hypothetical protein
MLHIPKNSFKLKKFRAYLWYYKLNAYKETIATRINVMFGSNQIPNEHSELVVVSHIKW